MATEIKLPRLGQGMESGTIVRWLKSEGDAVKKREPLYELDTDKVTQEVESDLDGDECGVLRRIDADARTFRQDDTDAGGVFEGAELFELLAHSATPA